jgi:hypothetical protein
MKLISIINVWADCIELLPYCIHNHLQFCNAIIVVGSLKSNHGTSSDAYQKYIERYPFGVTPTPRVFFEFCEPTEGLKPLVNETKKRNYGLEMAKKGGFSHFLIADADELYIPSEMNEEKKRFDNPNLNGLVHPLKVYIKLPTLYTYDKTLVCGIHKLHKDTSCGSYKNYPYAYDAAGVAQIDPSRRLYFTSGIEMSAVYCEHFSYVRKDINLKINNSSANLKKYKKTIYNELRDAKPGYVSRLYHQELKESENIFNLPIW